MKSKSKFNILLIAICALLVIVICMIGNTSSYLVSEHQIKMTTKVANIDVKLMQDTRELTETDNIVYLGTSIIEGDKVYDTNVKLKNSEISSSYYMRYKVVAMVDGEFFNITDYITLESVDESKFYLENGWMYYGTGSTKQVLPGAPSEDNPLILSIMKAFCIPSTASAGKLSTTTMQGKNFKLYLYLEGSPSINFDV